MALSRERVVDTGWTILQDYGLGDLSMRRLARELEVQPGALYWHVANKQELLTELAHRMVEPLARSAGADDQDPASRIRDVTLRFRGILLSVRDGAEVVSVAHALEPLDLEPVPVLTELLQRAGALAARGAQQSALAAPDGTAAFSSPAPDSPVGHPSGGVASPRSVALTLVRFTLGSVLAEQTRQGMDLGTGSSDREFQEGLAAILGGPVT